LRRYATLSLAYAYGGLKAAAMNLACLMARGLATVKTVDKA